MKIGIITTFRQTNWGSVLQAFALQRAVEKFGYTTEIIDYKYPNEFHWERGLEWGNNKKSLMPVLRRIKTSIACILGLRSWPMMTLMNSFINKNMKVSRFISSHNDLHSTPPIYDIYISGSDQIWNPNTMLGDMSYMFDFAPVTSKRISYASSFSCLSIPNKYQEDYKKYLSKYSAISVRENNGRKVISSLIGKDAKVVLDPTLLLDEEEWTQIASGAKRISLPPKYILCYMLSYTFEVDKPMGELLQKVQDKYNMPVVALNSMPDSFKGEVYNLPRSYSKGIPEFLYLIKNASIVVSSSFHGTAFALNFGRPLIAMGADNEDDRVSSLLQNMNLCNNFVLSTNIIIDDINPIYDKEKEQGHLSKLRQESLSFLKNSIER